MNGDPKRQGPLVIARILLALALILFTGFWGFITLFTDVSESWGFFGWALYILAGHALAGFLVGLLIPRRWTLALASSFGGLAFGLAGVIGLSTGAASASNIPLLNQVATTALALIAIPGVTALSAFQGSRLMLRKAARSKANA